jgi:hypothetical protein
MTELEYWDRKFEEHEIFFKAAQDGDLSTVKQLVESGFDVNDLDDGERTALMNAASGGHHNVVDFLLRNGADVNLREEIYTEQGYLGYTAILMVKEEKTIDLLLKYGANIDDIALVDGKGLLHWEVQGTDINRINFLLSRNASIDLEMQNGMTPLMIATRNKDIEIVRHLVKKGADVNHRDKIGVSVLQLAKNSGNKEIENYLVENGAIDNNPRFESLNIYQPDGYGIDNYFMGASKAIETDDGTTHVFFYGTGFASIWSDLSACRRLYFCIKDNRLLYHFAGRENGWYHFLEYDNEGHSRSIRIDNGSEDIDESFPEIKAKLRDCSIPSKIRLQFKPNAIDGIDIEEEFAALKKFFNEYVEIIDIDVEISGSNFTFYYPMFRFTEKGADFCGEVTYAESSNS